MILTTLNNSRVGHSMEVLLARGLEGNNSSLGKAEEVVGSSSTFSSRAVDFSFLADLGSEILYEEELASSAVEAFRSVADLE